MARPHACTNVPPIGTMEGSGAAATPAPPTPGGQGGPGGSGPPPPPAPLTRAECAAFSARCYCEENVVRVLRLAAARGHLRSGLFALFMSNPGRRVPLRFQRAGTGLMGVASWDYHVVAEVGCNVYDVDSLLPFPVPRADYFRFSCAPEDGIRFRRVPFDDVDRLFASDRRHMRRADGQLRMSPPAAPPLRGRDAPSGHTLSAFIDMGDVPEHDPFLPEPGVGPPPGTLFRDLDALLKALERDDG